MKKKLESGPDILACDHQIQLVDEVAEWLRRWTANPMGSARVGSNPILVVSFVQMLHYHTTVQLLQQQILFSNGKMFSVTGNRTRACWVRASYPNH